VVKNNAELIISAVQADKDNAKGNVDVLQHPCSGTSKYCHLNGEVLPDWIERFKALKGIYFFL
jgi:hypothetical protein